jgi:hypothetical protein
MRGMVRWMSFVSSAPVESKQADRYLSLTSPSKSRQIPL